MLAAGHNHVITMAAAGILIADGLNDHQIQLQEGGITIKSATDITLSGKNINIVASAQLTIDSTLPAMATNLTAEPNEATSPPSAVLNWNAAIDPAPASGIASYRVYRNLQVIGETPGTSFADDSASHNDSYNVVAIDNN